MSKSRRVNTGLEDGIGIGTGRGAKNDKVLKWREEVQDNGELAKFEEKLRGFVEDEREMMRSISRQS